MKPALVIAVSSMFSKSKRNQLTSGTGSRSSIGVPATKKRVTLAERLKMIVYNEREAAAKHSSVRADSVERYLRSKEQIIESLNKDPGAKTILRLEPEPKVNKRRRVEEPTLSESLEAPRESAIYPVRVMNHEPEPVSVAVQVGDERELIEAVILAPDDVLVTTATLKDVIKDFGVEITKSFERQGEKQAELERKRADNQDKMNHLLATAIEGMQRNISHHDRELTIMGDKMADLENQCLRTSAILSSGGPQAQIVKSLQKAVGLIKGQLSKGNAAAVPKKSSKRKQKQCRKCKKMYSVPYINLHVCTKSKPD